MGDATALVVCTKKGLFAVGSKCTHYGAPLEKGVLDGCRLKCPWHGAVFAVDTGDVEEAPAIDALPSYPLRVDDSGEVFVRVPQTDDSKKSARKHIIPDSALSGLSPQKFAIVGGGAAGLSAADTLRQAGFQGEVHMFTREANPPYDRTQLSKDPTKGTAVEKIYLRSREELQRMRVTVHYDTTVSGLDSASRTLQLSGGGAKEASFKYDEVLFATGSGARKAGVDGEQLTNVFTIRAPEEAAAITAALKGLGEGKADVVIIGSGFIGMEVAAFLVGKKELARSVTVVDRASVPMAKQLGEAVGHGLQRNHEKAGVKFVLDSGLEAIVDDGAGKVGGVRLKGGSTLGCQLVIVALGAEIQTQVLKADKAVELSDKDEVIVDKHYRNKSGIYAAGDIGQHLQPPLPLPSHSLAPQHQPAHYSPLLLYAVALEQPSGRTSPRRTSTSAWSTGRWRSRRVAPPPSACCTASRPTASTTYPTTGQCKSRRRVCATAATAATASTAWSWTAARTT